MEGKLRYNFGHHDANERAQGCTGWFARDSFSGYKKRTNAFIVIQKGQEDQGYVFIVFVMCFDFREYLGKQLQSTEQTQAVAARSWTVFMHLLYVCVSWCLSVYRTPVCLPYVAVTRINCPFLKFIKYHWKVWLLPLVLNFLYYCCGFLFVQCGMSSQLQ